MILTRAILTTVIHHRLLLLLSITTSILIITVIMILVVVPSSVAGMLFSFLLLYFNLFVFHFWLETKHVFGITVEVSYLCDSQLQKFTVCMFGFAVKKIDFERID
jgi:hypothetical protein